MKLLKIEIHKENVRVYGQGNSITINLAHIVYIEPDYPYYLLVITTGSFYIDSDTVRKIANEMMDVL